MADDLSAAERRVLDAAERLAHPDGQFIYDHPRGDDTPIPTCAGCGASDWMPARIKHHSTCAVKELVAAVRALRSQRSSGG